MWRERTRASKQRGRTHHFILASSLVVVRQGHGDLAPAQHRPGVPCRCASRRAQHAVGELSLYPGFQRQPAQSAATAGHGQHGLAGSRAHRHSWLACGPGAGPGHPAPLPAGAAAAAPSAALPAREERVLAWETASGIVACFVSTRCSLRSPMAPHICKADAACTAGTGLSRSCERSVQQPGLV